MKITEFRPAVESDFPEVKDPKVFEIISPVQKAAKDLVKLTQKYIGLENLNEDIIQVDLVPGYLVADPITGVITASGDWNTIETSNIKGNIQGALPILIDYPGGTLIGWGCEVTSSTQLNVRIIVTPATTNSITTRIWVKGS